MENARRLQVETAMNSSMNAVFAEYHRELLEQYDLLAIDTSYGSGNTQVQNTAKHLQNYMNGNLGEGLLRRSDMLGLYAKDALAHSVVRLTDAEGKVMQWQAITYLYGLAGVDKEWEEKEKNQPSYPSELTDESAMERMWGQANRELDAQELPTRRNEDDQEEVVSLNNPADAVCSMKSLGILRLTVDDLDKISNEMLQEEELVSRRVCLTTDSEEVEEPYLSVTDRILFQQYLFQKMGSYAKEKENSRLKYQLEYLIAGNLGDYQNLESIANRICLMRFFLNYRFLSNNGAKVAEAKAAAMALTAVMLKPELEPFVTKTLLFAWAYAESVQDVRRLLDGGRVPLNKTDADWRVSLRGLGNFHHSGGGNRGENGLDYEAYLRMLIGVTPQKLLVQRAMDVMETDIRQTEGNSRFRLDACIVSLDASVTVSENRREYVIRRKFAY